MDETGSGDASAARQRTIAFATIYGLVCHLAYIASAAVMIAVMYTGMSAGLGRVPAPWAWLANAGLLIQFPVIHSALLSKRGTAFMRGLIPGNLGTPLLTTTYVLIASMQQGVIFLFWTPTHHVLWQAQGPVLFAITIGYAGAWILLARSIVDAGFAAQVGLLGWRSVVQGRPPAYPPMPKRGLFAWCRQPIYLSFALASVLVPTVTPDSLAIMLILGGYCLVGPRLKEARWSRRYGAEFTAYQAKVPYWIPRPPAHGERTG